MARKLSKAEKFAEGKHRGYPQIVAEGDSWFSVVLYNDVVDHLFWYNYAVNNAAHFGDEIEGDMLGHKEEWLDRINGDTKALIFSGGGNDILDKPAMRALLKKRADVNTREELIIDGELKARIARLKGHYEQVIQLAHQKAGWQLPIITHGYDYIIPRNQKTNILWTGVAGPWAWKVLNGDDPEAKGITLASDRAYVVKTLIDAFNEMLFNLAAANGPFFKYVDVRNTIDRDEWKDEIHPNTSGFKKVAKKFHNVLRTVA